MRGQTRRQRGRAHGARRAYRELARRRPQDVLAPQPCASVPQPDDLYPLSRDQTAPAMAARRRIAPTCRRGGLRAGAIEVTMRPYQGLGGFAWG